MIITTIGRSKDSRMFVVQDNEKKAVVGALKEGETLGGLKIWEIKLLHPIINPQPKLKIYVKSEKELKNAVLNFASGFLK